MKLGILLLILIVPFSKSLACDPISVDAVVDVFVDVGMWDATLAGFDYQRAAYKMLGEELDSRSYLDNADTVFVVFTYRASILGLSSMFQVNLCLSRDINQSWKDAALDLLEQPGDGGGGTASGGGGTATGADGDYDWGNEDWGEDWWDENWQEQQ